MLKKIYIDYSCIFKNITFWYIFTVIIAAYFLIFIIIQEIILKNGLNFGSIMISILFCFCSIVFSKTLLFDFIIKDILKDNSILYSLIDKDIQNKIDNNIEFQLYIKDYLNQYGKSFHYLTNKEYNKLISKFNKIMKNEHIIYDKYLAKYDI